ncbi:MAG: hypothetical protein JXA71_07265 [Chitinispirillaceae bacterium]|nr:hypothetical protein [Chitinispirillaceae bacterium]
MQRTVHMYRHSMLCLSTMAFLVHVPAFAAETPADLLVNQFFRMDSIFAASVRAVEPMEKGDSTWIQRYFRELLQRYPEFYAVIVADESGKVFSTISYETLDSNYSGIVAEREWFHSARAMESPYYGGLSWINGRYCLVWSKPCIGRTALGIKKCGGVVTALINVAQCLQTFTDDYGQPFELLQDNATFYHSDDWRADLASHEQAIELLGDLTFVLRYGQNRPARQDAAASRLAGKGAPGEDPESSIVQAQHRRGSARGMRDSGAMAFLCGAAVVGAFAVFIVLLFRRRYTAVPGAGLRARQAQEPVEDRESVKRQVFADLYAEIKDRIERYEIAKIENDVRERLQREMRARALRGVTEEKRAAMLVEIEEEERRNLREKLYRKLVASKQDDLYREACALARADVLSRLTKKERQRLKEEAVQELAATVEQEARSEHETALREKALRDLDERVRKDVEVKERTRLTLRIREELRARLEKEVEHEEAAQFRRELRKKIRRSVAEPVDAVAVVSDREPHDPADGLMRAPGNKGTAANRLKESESEVLVSLAKTVSMLRKQYHDSPLFKLNEAQTAAMIDYLEKISNRLNGYFTEINDGIEQAVFGSEQDGLGTYAGKRGDVQHNEGAGGPERPGNRITFDSPPDSRELRTGTDE